MFGLGPGSQVSENKGSAGPFIRLVRGKEGDSSADGGEALWSWRCHCVWGRLIAGTPPSPSDLAQPLFPSSGAASSPPTPTAVQHPGVRRGLSPRPGRPHALPGPLRLSLGAPTKPSWPLDPVSFKGGTAHSTWQPRALRAARGRSDGSLPSIRGDLLPPPVLPPLSSQTTPAAPGLAGSRLFLFPHPWDGDSRP